MVKQHLISLSVIAFFAMSLICSGQQPNQVNFAENAQDIYSKLEEDTALFNNLTKSGRINIVYPKVKQPYALNWPKSYIARHDPYYIKCSNIRTEKGFAMFLSQFTVSCLFEVYPKDIAMQIISGHLLKAILYLNFGKSGNDSIDSIYYDAHEIFVASKNPRMYIQLINRVLEKIDSMKGFEMPRSYLTELASRQIPPVPVENIYICSFPLSMRGFMLWKNESNIPKDSLSLGLIEEFLRCRLE